MLSLVTVEPLRLGLYVETEVVPKTVLSNEMRLSDSCESPDPDSSRSIGLHWLMGVQLEEGRGLNQSMVVYDLLWIFPYYGAKRFTSDNSFSYDSLDIS